MCWSVRVLAVRVALCWTQVYSMYIVLHRQASAAHGTSTIELQSLLRRLTAAARERERVSEKAVTIDSVSTRRQAKRRRRRRRRRLDCNYQTNQTKAKAVLVAMLCVCVMLHRKQRRPSSSVTLFCRWIWRTAVISNLTVVKLLGPTGRVELALHLTQHAQQAARRRDAVAADRSLHHTHIIIIISSSKSQHCVSKTSPFIA